MASSNMFSAGSSGLGSHSLTVYKAWKKLQSLVQAVEFEIDGNSLDVPSVVAVSRCLL